MATVTVDMAELGVNERHAGSRWDQASVKRAAARIGMVSTHDPRVPWPTSEKIMRLGADGKGMVWDEGGQTIRAQVWCQGPYAKTYWYRVWQGCEAFPGELRLVETDGEGRVWLRDRCRYDAHGTRITEEGRTA